MTPNQRRPDETQAEFRDRLKKAKVDQKAAPRAKMLWPAWKGTYVRAVHGDLGE